MSRLRSAYNSGLMRALTRHKLAQGTPAGASPGVMPSGSEMSHGTERIPYAIRQRQNADVGEHMPQDQFNADWLWDNQDLSHMAPGNVSGYGQEVIG